VGFIGGHQAEILGPDHGLASGALAACVVTWFTFLPSFVFILAGGPLVESTHNNLKLTAPLTAITAAVSGVVLNLALFFGYHVLLPEGWRREIGWGIDPIATLIAIGAAIDEFKHAEVIDLIRGLSFVLTTLLAEVGYQKDDAIEAFVYALNRAIAAKSTATSH
jgi:chromate transporter